MAASRGSASSDPASRPPPSLALVQRAEGALRELLAQGQVHQASEQLLLIGVGMAEAKAGECHFPRPSIRIFHELELAPRGHRPKDVQLHGFRIGSRVPRDGSLGKGRHSEKLAHRAGAPPPPVTWRMAGLDLRALVHRERTLLVYALRLTRKPEAMSRDDVDALRAAAVSSAAGLAEARVEIAAQLILTRDVRPVEAGRVVRRAGALVRVVVRLVILHHVIARQRVVVVAWNAATAVVLTTW